MAAFVTHESVAYANSFTLSYHARGLCPGEGELLRQVQARTGLARRVKEHGALDVSVEVKGENGSAHGTMAWSEASATTEREVEGADCDEVVSALALMLALALDPDAATGPLPPPPAPTPAPTLPPPAMASVPRVVKSEPAFHFGGGVTFGMTSGVAPELRPYLGLGLEVTRDHARLGLSGLVSKGTADTATGSADLSWWALRLAACPAQLASGAWFVEPCATFDAGKLSGSGYDTRNRRSASATWYGPGAQLRAGVVGFGVLAVTVEGGAVAPLARDRFYFAPDETAHQIPSLAGYVGAALGARL